MQLNENHNQHLTREEFLDYNSKKLSPIEMHRIEKHLLECSLCEAAINGIDKSDDYLRTVNTLRELRKKGNKKFQTPKKKYLMIDNNIIIAFLFILGMLIFISYFLMRIIK